MFLGILGGFVLGVAAGVVTPTQYVYGIQYDFRPYYVTYAVIKTLFLDLLFLPFLLTKDTIQKAAR